MTAAKRTMTANGTTTPKGQLPFGRPEKTTTSPELAERFMTANNDGGLRGDVGFTAKDLQRDE
jgi:hypothetical protein